jgi:hypothetical protein
MLVHFKKGKSWSTMLCSDMVPLILSSTDLKVFPFEYTLSLQLAVEDGNVKEFREICTSLNTGGPSTWVRGDGRTPSYLEPL